MNSVERVKDICRDRKIPISKLEKDLGFSNGYVGQLRKGVFPDDRLGKIADYLGVTVDYLMNGEKPSNKAKDERDIKQALEDFKNRLSTAGIMCDGEPIDEDAPAGDHQPRAGGAASGRRNRPALQSVFADVVLRMPAV